MCRKNVRYCSRARPVCGRRNRKRRKQNDAQKREEEAQNWTDERNRRIQGDIQRKKATVIEKAGVRKPR